MRLYISILCLFTLFACDSGQKDTQEKTLAAEVEYIKSPNSLVELTQKYKGYVLYVDIWASWCGPCMREMKPAHGLKSNFATSDKIKFIYINSSDSENRWKSAIDVKNITGVNLQANEDLFKDLQENYGLTSYPRYMIIGKDGKLINGDASRPSDTETKQILKKLLKTNNT